jgi:Uma2 family endonuclease
MVRTEDRHIFRDRRVFGVPSLLVEVLSPSNPEQDLEVKRDAYAHAAVPEY